jgi:hypothetical protein
MVEEEYQVPDPNPVHRRAVTRLTVVSGWGVDVAVTWISRGRFVIATYSKGRSRDGYFGRT